MTLREKLATLSDGSWLMIVAPRIDHILTATSCVGITKDGVVRVKYEDGVIEERRGSDAVLDGMSADNPSLFFLVQYVQDGRKETA